MSRRFVAAALAAALVAACRAAETPIPHTPTTLAIVSGSNQTGDPAKALASPLVVRATDAAGRVVSGVAIGWTVTGGGSVSPATATTDAQGEATGTWTLGPTPGTQTATATSSAMSGAAAAFVAGNGPTITGTVSIANPDPTTFFSARRAPARATAPHGSTAPRYSNGGLVVTFHREPFHAAAAGSPAYRSLAVARSTAAALRQRVAALTRGLPVGGIRVSPAILAAHVALADSTKVAQVMAALRADPSVAGVSRDAIYTIRDGAPAPQAVRFVPVHGAAAGGDVPAGAATALPNDPDYALQSWNANMVDLPRAWAITTGSSAFTIADIDMGVRFDDPTLAPNLTNDGYDFVSQTTLVDLGYDSVGTICGGGGTFTTIDGDGNGPDPDPTDPNDVAFDATNKCWQPAALGDHGQWTSGIIGAVGNDGQAVTGVNWTARIRPIRVLGITGDGIGFDVAQGILYAAGLAATGANGALVTAPTRSPIINLSLGGTGVDPADQAAVAAAVQAGCLIVASAGNQTSDTPVYPAAYPGVIGVSAVGMDGVIASYSNAGTWVSLAAPGGEFRTDDNGGDGVLGPGWNFVAGQPVLLFGYGTSAAAPHVSGVAALLLAHEPGLTAAQLTTRLERYASRPPNSTRNDEYGWGIVNAYDALTQQDGPPRRRYVRLLDATGGAILKLVPVDATGAFALTQLAPGNYELEAGQDEAGDGAIGIPGRRFAWAGSAAAPTVFTATSGSSLVQTAGIAIGVPAESEPNDDTTSANPLSVGGYVVGQITPPDAADYYRVLVPAAGTYTFETSGVMGACGWGLELDTDLQLLGAGQAVVASNDNSGAPTGPFCSRITSALSPGTYYVVVTGSSANGLADHGRYRLQVRAGN